MLKLFFRALVGIVILAVTLPVDAAVLREQEILDLVRNEVVLRLQVPKRDVEVEWQDMQLSSLLPAIPEGQLTMSIAQTTRLGGRGNVPVLLSIDGKKFRTIFPRLDVRIFQAVLVAKNRIGRGSPANESDVMVQRQPVSGFNIVPLTKFNDVLGSESTRDIAPGTVLTAQMFKIPPMIKAGDEVNIILYSGGLTIITSGVARSTGGRGQMIKVLNRESKVEIVGRVVGPNRVEIRLEE